MRGTGNTSIEYVTVLQGNISDLETKLQKATDDYHTLENDHQECQYDGVTTSVDQSALTTA